MGNRRWIGQQAILCRRENEGLCQAAAAWHSCRLVYEAVVLAQRGTLGVRKRAEPTRPQIFRQKNGSNRRVEKTAPEFRAAFYCLLLSPFGIESVTAFDLALLSAKSGVPVFITKYRASSLTSNFLVSSSDSS